MSEYRRAQVKGGCYFFTVITKDRSPFLVREDVRLALRTSIQKVHVRFPFTVEGWVLLPDHLHCLWTLPADDHDFSKRWSLIKRYTSQQLAGMPGWEPKKSEGNRREAGLWQRRFWEHLIRDEADFRNHMDYMHWNPVKHGLVTNAAAWPYSTFHRLVAQGVYPGLWGGDCVRDDGAAVGE